MKLGGTTQSRRHAAGLCTACAAPVPARADGSRPYECATCATFRRAYEAERRNMPARRCGCSIRGPHRAACPRARRAA